MKFKKLLSFTLATTMAFTSTLSSSVSGFADDNQETEESKSFASSIFDELFAQSQEGNTEDSDEYAISPMWLSGGHDGIIDYSSGSISSAHIEIMKHCSAWADDCFPSAYSKDKATTYVESILALHGSDNYVINLEFLWYFAVFLGREDNPTNTTEMNNAIKSARSNAIEKIKNTSAYANKDYNNLQNLITNSGTLVKYNGANKKKDTLLSNSKMKTRILGYAAHLAGDVFSHRTMVPSANDLEKSYFISTLNDDVASGIVEFRYLAKTTDQSGYLIDESNKSEVNEKYVDSTTFYSNRYNNATVNVYLMLTHNQGGFDYYLFLCPYSNNVKLSNFKKFVTSSGLDTSKLTASEWAKYST